jgi:hypothetical protein
MRRRGHHAWRARSGAPVLVVYLNYFVLLLMRGLVILARKDDVMLFTPVTPPNYIQPPTLLATGRDQWVRTTDLRF